MVRRRRDCQMSEIHCMPCSTRFRPTQPHFSSPHLTPRNSRSPDLTMPLDAPNPTPFSLREVGTVRTPASTRRRTGPHNNTKWELWNGMFALRTLPVICANGCGLRRSRGQFSNFIRFGSALLGCSPMRIAQIFATLFGPSHRCIQKLGRRLCPSADQQCSSSLKLETFLSILNFLQT